MSKESELDKIIRAGKTDEEMEYERIYKMHPSPEHMLVIKLGDPRPRMLPDGRVIKDPDDLKEVEGLSDEEAMAWLDIPIAQIRRK